MTYCSVRLRLVDSAWGKVSYSRAEATSRLTVAKLDPFISAVDAIDHRGPTLRTTRASTSQLACRACTMVPSPMSNRFVLTSRDCAIRIFHASVVRFALLDREYWV